MLPRPELEPLRVGSSVAPALLVVVDVGLLAVSPIGRPLTPRGRSACSAHGRSSGASGRRCRGPASRRWRAARAPSAGRSWSPSSISFAGVRSELLHGLPPRRRSRPFLPPLASAAVRTASVHVLRRVWASALLDLGGPPLDDGPLAGDGLLGVAQRRALSLELGPHPLGPRRHTGHVRLALLDLDLAHLDSSRALVDGRARARPASPAGGRAGPRAARGQPRPRADLASRSRRSAASRSTAAGCLLLGLATFALASFEVHFWPHLESPRPAAAPPTSASAFSSFSYGRRTRRAGVDLGECGSLSAIAEPLLGLGHCSYPRLASPRARLDSSWRPSRAFSLSAACGRSMSRSYRARARLEVAAAWLRPPCSRARPRRAGPRRLELLRRARRARGPRPLPTSAIRRSAAALQARRPSPRRFSIIDWTCGRAPHVALLELGLGRGDARPTPRARPPDLVWSGGSGSRPRPAYDGGRRGPRARPAVRSRSFSACSMPRISASRPLHRCSRGRRPRAAPSASDLFDLLGAVLPIVSSASSLVIGPRARRARRSRSLPGRAAARQGLSRSRSTCSRWRCSWSTCCSSVWVALFELGRAGVSTGGVPLRLPARKSQSGGAVARAWSACSRRPARPARSSSRCCRVDAGRRRRPPHPCSTTRFPRSRRVRPRAWRARARGGPAGLALGEDDLRLLLQRRLLALEAFLGLRSEAIRCSIALRSPLAVASRAGCSGCASASLMCQTSWDENVWMEPCGWTSRPGGRCRRP